MNGRMHHLHVEFLRASIMGPFPFTLLVYVLPLEVDFEKV